MDSKKKFNNSDTNGCGCLLFFVLLIVFVVYEIYFWFTHKASKATKIVLIISGIIILAAIISLLSYKIIKKLNSKFHFIKKKNQLVSSDEQNPHETFTNSNSENSEQEDTNSHKAQNKPFFLTISNLLEYVDGMSADGAKFEEFCCTILRFNGFYNVQMTRSSSDYGVDILAEKDGITYAIQCKCYSDKVGNKAVQEAYSGKSFYDRMVAAVLTNNYFTNAAIETAKANNVLLWNRGYLSKLMKALVITQNQFEIEEFGHLNNSSNNNSIQEIESDETGNE